MQNLSFHTKLIIGVYLSFYALNDPPIFLLWVLIEPKGFPCAENDPIILLYVRFTSMNNNRATLLWGQTGKVCTYLVHQCLLNSFKKQAQCHWQYILTQLISSMDGFDPVMIFGVLTYDIWFSTLLGAYHPLWKLKGSQFTATTVTNSLILFDFDMIWLRKDYAGKCH